MYINWKRKELIITIALYGPPKSGKTTTWRVLAAGAIAPLKKGEDTFSLRLENVQDKQVILHLRDVPGGPDAAAQRRTALYGVDGLIFVADSDAAHQKANHASITELGENLKAMQKSMHSMPFILQYNKRDLASALPVQALQDCLNQDRLFPFQETIAIQSNGVLQVLRQATDLVLTTAL